MLKMATGKLNAKEERELYDLKQKAIEYYADNGVPQKMEEILNAMFYDCPNDVFGHLVITIFIIVLNTYLQCYVVSVD